MLGSDSVMQLTNETDDDQVYKLLLERRSLYVLSGESRSRFAHSIDDEEQEFEGRAVAKGRRVSVMIRDW